MTYVVFWPHITNLEGRLDLFEKAFPRYLNNWVEKFSDFNAEYEGAVVIINGGCGTVPDMRVLNDQIRNFRWVLLVSVGDEGSNQHLEWIDHPNVSIWVMEPKPGKHDKFNRMPAWSLSGYELVSNFEKEIKEKPLDWFFSGSIRDKFWDEAIRNLPGKGKYFSYHLGYETSTGYMWSLATAKIIPCRPCLSIPETCRVYDALEAHCIPIVGIYPGTNPSTGHQWWPSFNYDWPNYWEYVLGEKPPFPIIKDPSDLNEVFQETLNNWSPEQAQKVYEWWVGYKAKFIERLRNDVRRLQQ